VHHLVLVLPKVHHLRLVLPKVQHLLLVLPKVHHLVLVAGRWCWSSSFDTSLGLGFGTFFFGNGRPP
jgi:hypothetical protein